MSNSRTPSQSDKDPYLKAIAGIFIGVWNKVTNSPCSKSYPAVLEFRAAGLYLGKGMESGPSPGWDSGTWRLVDMTKIMISTANDAIISYNFSIVNGELIFVDLAGCEFRYKKVTQIS